MAVYFGIGSWADAAYADLVYPKGTRPENLLREYSARFPIVEVNSSYYATPRAEATACWEKNTPDDFKFEIKLHRAFSRNPGKIAREGKFIEWVQSGVEPLRAAGKIGAFLLVLSERFSPATDDLQELAAVARALRPQLLAVELRNRAWISGDRLGGTLDFFRREKIVWVAVDFPTIPGSALMPAIDEVTNPELAYLRLHGRNPHYLEAKSAAAGHEYAYSDEELRDILKRVRKLADQARDVHVFANNHARDFAPRTALRLAALWNEGAVAGTGTEDIASKIKDGVRREMPNDPSPSNAGKFRVAAEIPPLSVAIETHPIAIEKFPQLKPNQKIVMAKNQNAKKETKKAPTKSAKEKKMGKAMKKKGK